MSRGLRICIVNRNYPPESGATGYYAQRLVDSLAHHMDMDIHVVTVGTRVDSNHMSYVRPHYQGKIKWIRLFSTYFEGRQLIKKARAINADVYVIMTDPPFLNYWAARMLTDQKWILWSMDLYPEAFVANHLITADRVLYKYYQSMIRSNPPDYLISLGMSQLQYLQTHYYPKVEGVTIPIGLRDQKGPVVRNRADDGSITFGYIGSIGEAHDEEAIITFVKAIAPYEHSFILCSKGSKSTYVTSQIEHIGYVSIKNELWEDELNMIDIHLVTLQPEWTHICVPSKAISAIQKGRPVLFMGSEDSDTWQLIRMGGWIITEDYDILAFLNDLDQKELKAKELKALEVAARLNSHYQMSIQEIKEKIKQLNQEV